MYFPNVMQMKIIMWSHVYREKNGRCTNCLMRSTTFSLAALIYFILVWSCLWAALYLQLSLHFDFLNVKLC